MKTNLTASQIEARERLYQAYSKEQGIVLRKEDVRQLWSSIFATGRELSSLRDKLRDIADIAFDAKLDK